MEWYSASDAWLGRWLFERGLAITYLIAFAVVLNQFRPLLGEHGLLPVPRFVSAVPFKRSPSLFHRHYSDRLVAAVGWFGIVVGTALLLEIPQRVAAPLAMACWAALWALYVSVVNVGQRFYSFGWESLLCEAGFLAVFLGGSGSEPPVLVMFLLRWLLFRLELGAGLIKLRGDPCWRDLTCLRFHHETQPMPGPLSAWFHHLPASLHRVEVLANHVAQLVVPWFLFAPAPVSTVAAIIIAVTQGYLMISGNFAWLNFLTIALALSVVDGSVLARVVPVDPPAHLAGTPGWLTALTLGLAAFVVVRSIPIVANLLSSHQRMNASFDRLHLVNTYGAFGSVTKVRREVVIEGTLAERPGPDTAWLEYGVRGKPGDVRRRPPQVAPYHLRLGWLLWFVALSPSYGDGWLEPLLRRLLEADPSTLALFDHDPFGGARPAFVRARLFRYELTTREERIATGAWWRRQPTGVLQPAMGLARR
ncbi:MAG: lipase maturation factor family protein [Acidimicrobiales bacterium]